MQEQFRPSKQFLVRGAIATGIVAIVLIVQTDWFRALFHKPPLAPVVSNKTVGEFIAKDSNNNGYADWEEKLWGLDPTALYTDGTPNATIIEERKRALGVSSAENTPENETDALARELLTISAALGQSGELTDESLAAVGARLAESVEFQQYINHYSLKDVRTVQTTTASLSAYHAALIRITTKYESGPSDIGVLVQAFESGDMAETAVLSSTQKKYEQAAQELIALSVPIGLQKDHLEIVNSVYGLSVALGYLTDLEDNGANALAGIALYKINDTRLTTASEDMRVYLVRYGILKE